MQAILQQEQVKQVWHESNNNEKKVGLIAGIFGCWHKELSRPFTMKKNDSYRVCNHCGARRHFNTQTLETYGQFYFPLETGASNTNEARF